MRRVIKQKLSEIALISAGKNAPKDESFNLNEGLPFIRASHLNNLVSDSSFIGKIPRVNDKIAQSLKLNIVKKNSILFAKSGMSATMNRIVKIINDAYFVNHLACITPREDILDSDFLKYFLYFFNPSNLIQGEAYPSINLSVIADLEIPLPSLAAQKAIAEKLDKADALRKKDQELLAHYDELAQSIFIDMFGDPVQNEMGWEKLKLENVCNKITDGEHTTPKRELEGVYLLSARNVKNGFIDLNVGVDYISEDEYTRISKRCMPENGDVLISCSGSVGRVSIVNVDYKFSLVRSVALLKVKKDVINPLFLNYYMLTNYFKQQIDKGSKKSSQANIFIGAIKELITIIPPLALQTAFAEKIKNIELQKALVKRQAEQSEDLFQALLQESFSF